MKTPELSIVTVSMNHDLYLYDLCKSLSLERKTIDFEMIMIDNCSNDQTQHIIANDFPWVWFVNNKRIRSFSYNNNKGISLSKGRYILILNPDVKVLPGALRTLVDFMDKNPDVGVCGPKLLNSDLSIQSSCRRYSTPSVLMIRGLRLDLLFRNQKKIADYMMTEICRKFPQDVDWLMGSSMLLRRAALVEAGLFDERFPLYFEDQDLCRRMNEQGWRVCYVPQAEMIHHHARHSAKRPFGKAARMHYKSMLYYFLKYYFYSGKIKPLNSHFFQAPRASDVGKTPLPPSPNLMPGSRSKKDIKEAAFSNS